MSEIQRRKQDFIEDLDVGKRDLYAEMVMRSLRGSWSNPRPRAEILATIGHVGGLLAYDDDSIQSKAERYLETGEERGHWDGRTFRSVYGEVEIADYDESTVRLLSSHIPDDMTWDNWRIEKEFSEGDDE